MTRRVSDDPAQRERAQQIRNAMETALALGRLRETREMTQVELAQEMGTTQRNVSRIEHQGDLHLSTLRDHIAALGGKLELAAVFPDDRVEIGTPASDGVEEDKLVRWDPYAFSTPRCAFDCHARTRRAREILLLAVVLPG